MNANLSSAPRSASPPTSRPSNKPESHRPASPDSGKAHPFQESLERARRKFAKTENASPETAQTMAANTVNSPRIELPPTNTNTNTDLKEVVQLISDIQAQSEIGAAESDALLLKFVSSGWPVGTINLAKDRFGLIQIRLTSKAQTIDALKRQVGQLRGQLRARNISVGQISVL